MASTPAPSVGRLRPAAEAWSKIAEPLRARKGIRVVFLGVSGKGKTHGVEDFLDYARDQRLVDLVMIHDVKLATPQYAGPVINEASELFTPEGAPTTFPATAVLRKRDLDHMPSVEILARRTLEAGYNDLAAMAVIDEFQRALTDGGKFEAPSVRRLFCEGFGLHASIVVTKQLPQFMPNEARAQSDLVIFGLNGGGASFLVDDKTIEEKTADIVRGLRQREFIYVPCEGDFDGNVYQVPSR